MAEEEEVRIDEQVFGSHLNQLVEGIKGKDFGGIGSLLCVLGKQTDEAAYSKSALLHVRLRLSDMLVAFRSSR